MSTNLAPASEAPAAARPLPGFANPLRQLGGIIGQPAVKRSLPMILLVCLVLAAALAWAMVSTPPQRILFTDLPDADKAAVAEALQQAGIDTGFDGGGAITVAEDAYHKARMLLASQDLPRAAPGGYAILDQLPMGVSRAVEGERLRQARETELARSIAELDSVADARVHLAMPESSVFVRDRAEPSASVIVRLQPGRTLSEAQVRSVVNLVASSVPGMQTEAVTIVDQLGALLSRPDGDIGTSAGDTRIDFERRVEDEYRTKLFQLLTPLVGAGNFTAEVQADVNLDESQATRESYDREGVVRAEQGNWTGAPREQAPGGIPGALSNTAPIPGSVESPDAATAAAPAAADVAPSTAPMRQSDSFARTYDLGKEVSVTRTVPGAVQRISVAVLLRNPEGQPRTEAEIRQITELVRAAVGYNEARQDQVTVVSRAFTNNADVREGPAWYEAGWVAMVARHVTAVVIALLVLLLGVRPLAKALLKKRDEGAMHRPALAAAQPSAAEPQPGVSVDMLDRGRSYDDRVGLVRGFTRDNPARAALAVRDMIRTNAP